MGTCASNHIAAGRDVRSVAVFGFFRDGNALVCDGVPLEQIAADHGTPLYVYSAESVRRSYRDLDEAFGAHPHRIHYALKANSSFAIAKLLRSVGSAVDANSIGEVELAMRAGFAPADIVFSGVGKSPDEIDRAVQLGLKAVNAESAGELERIDRAAQARGVRARVAVRVNPDIDAGTHPHISTGLHINKFGVPLEQAAALYRRMATQPGLEPVGIHVHLGSQIISTEPIQRAAAAVVKLARELRDAGIQLEHIDVGGGLGISYDGSRVPTAGEYAAAVLAIVGPSGLSVTLEPGRYIIGAAAVLLARVVDVKPAAGGHHFAVLDAGMTELMRPALYGSFHRIEPVTPRHGRELCYDIVGPVCESTDALGHDRRLPALEVGDLLAILDAGAYGSAMSSNYNRRPLPPEVLVDSGKVTLIRRRQTIDDQLALETRFQNFDSRF
jgi:diaminopimelate decarboxylase